MEQPKLSEVSIWERHEARVLALLRSALTILSTRELGLSEGELNRELYFCLLEANRVAREAGDEYFDSTPMFEARNPPTPDTEDSSSERKIPDLSWGYLDHQAEDARRSARHFVIECKRLGAPTTSGWVFNVHYVDDGVRRFVDPDWRYGKDVASGAMVGYVQSMSAHDVLLEVNKAVDAHKLSMIEHVASDGVLHELMHKLARSFADSPFHLTHLWIDITT